MMLKKCHLKERKKQKGYIDNNKRKEIFNKNMFIDSFLSYKLQDL